MITDLLAGADSVAVVVGDAPDTVGEVEGSPGARGELA